MRADATLAVLALFAAPAWAQGTAEAPLITGTPQWIERPRYQPPHPPARTNLPARALVVLDCLISSDGRLRCLILSEDPPGWGFGQAALRLSRDYRMAPLTVEGQPTAGGHYRLRLPFEMH